MKRHETKLLIWMLVLLAAVLLLTPLRPERTERLVFRNDKLQLMIGEEVQLKYVLEADSGHLPEFTSDAPLIASVNQHGVVTAISPGTATITLDAGDGLVATADVRVAGVPVTQLSINIDNLTMQRGRRSLLIAQTNQGATDARVRWLSDAPDVVSVDQNGQIEALGGGSARITATSVNGLTAEAFVEVRVPAESVRIEPSPLVMGIGAEVDLRTMFTPADATEEISVWESTDESVIKVDESGRVTAVGTGSARVRLVTRSALAAYADVTVEAPAESIAVLPAEITVARGGEVMLAAAIAPEECTDHHVIWTSDAPEIAEVENGAVRALKAGIAHITAVVDGKASAPCTVTVRIMPESVALDVHEIALTTADTAAPVRLTAQVLPADAEDRTVKFASDNEQIATVVADGMVAFTGQPGTVRITATTVNGLSDTCTITVAEAQP